MLKKNIIIVFLCLIAISAYSPGFSKTEDGTTLTLLFAGDIMGHMPQVEAAYDSASAAYNFDSTFLYVKPLFSVYDFVAANFETTLAGAPYSGYPQFSSPDALALACKNAGIQCLVTANNHCCDKGRKGLGRTIIMLDSLAIMHTGTFSDSAEKSITHPLIIDNKGIRIALLNYTFSTNGIPVPHPYVVNMTDTAVIARDIALTTKMNVDKIIVFIHWGNEYQQIPDATQKSLADFCFSKGVDIIIGAHPHVIQPIIWHKDSVNGKDQVTVYSLGNFVSNQRKTGTDGGIMAALTLSKKGNVTSITDVGYIPTWVYTPVIKGKKKYFILPAAWYENEPDFFQNKEQYDTFIAFLNASRTFLKKNNIHAAEYPPEKIKPLQNSFKPE